MPLLHVHREHMDYQGRVAQDANLADFHTAPGVWNGQFQDQLT